MDTWYQHLSVHLDVCLMKVDKFVNWKGFLNSWGSLHSRCFLIVCFCVRLLIFLVGCVISGYIFRCVVRTKRRTLKVLFVRENVEKY